MSEKLTLENHALAAEWDYEKNGNLRPEDFTGGSNKKVWWKCKYGHSWEAVIYTRKNSGCPYCAGVRVTIGVNDLLTVNPVLAAEWDYEKNGDLRPDCISAYTHKKVWWRCDKGHSWQAAISNRSNGNRCPYCANQLVLKGFNDLLTADPELCKDWDYDKNGALRPDEVVKNARKQVWWKCKKRHSWKSCVGDRRRGSGCPVCASHIIIPGENDLKSKRPELAAEWDYDKNSDLRPDSVAARTLKKVWWRCKHGHSYIASVSHRYRGTGCPYCGGDLPILGQNDLATVHPELAAEWDYERNDPLRPEDVTSGSFRKVWWKCKRGHYWETSTQSRVRGSDCPQCKGKTPMKTRLVT